MTRSKKTKRVSQTKEAAIVKRLEKVVCLAQEVVDQSGARPEPLVTPTRVISVEQADRVFSDGILIDLDIGYWTGVRRNTEEELGVVEKPDYVIGVGTKRLIPKEYHNTWQSLGSAARRWLDVYSFPFPVAAARFVPAAALPTLEKHLAEVKQEYEESVAEFVDQYEKIQEKMQADFPDQWNKYLKPYYPPRAEVQRAFYFTWKAFTVSVPKKIKWSPLDRRKHAEQEAALERYRQELAQQMDAFLGDAVKALREMTKEVCGRISERIAKGEVVTAKTLGAIGRFLDRYRTLNFMHDQEIDQVLNELQKQALGDLDLGDAKAIREQAETIQENAGFRKALQLALTEVHEAASSLTDVDAVSGEYLRRIQMED